MKYFNKLLTDNWHDFKVLYSNYSNRLKDFSKFKTNLTVAKVANSSWFHCLYNEFLLTVSEVCLLIEILFVFAAHNISNCLFQVFYCYHYCAWLPYLRCVNFKFEGIHRVFISVFSFTLINSRSYCSLWKFWIVISSLLNKIRC